ncbi:MAG: glycerol-3-phosphate 1-O-acyltransferase PlsY [Lentisphaeria bacterium]|nr:glycerol-3-phosphate 1-O-acyltransferase PlsY [Lentisphaeria bacterium]
MILLIFAIIVGSYLLGSIPFGLLIGKMNGIDIRKVGSCNIGATNVSRTVGKNWGKLCFFLDLMKGFLPTFIATMIFSKNAELKSFVPLLAGAASMLGHMFSIYLKFTGGKGVATGGGIILGLAPWTFVAAIISWAIVFLISRYVSLASIVAAASLAIYAIIFRFLGIQFVPWISIIFFAVIGSIAIYRHHSNIKRLLNGTENKFERKK